MVTILNSRRSAVFFSVDRTVRRVKAEVLRNYIDLNGEAPPVPVKVGDQELILPVVEHIKKLCDEMHAIPVAIDMAPYIESKEISEHQYLAVLSEFKGLMAEHGLDNMKYYMCPHMPKADADLIAPTRFDYKPDCVCRFPNNNLIRKACTDLNIKASTDEYGAFRVWPPSLFIGNSKDDLGGAYHDEREAAAMRSQMNFIQVGAILDGSINWGDLIGHEHLKAARAIQQEVKKLGRHVGTKIDITAAADAMLSNIVE